MDGQRSCRRACFDSGQLGHDRLSLFHQPQRGVVQIAQLGLTGLVLGDLDQVALLKKFAEMPVDTVHVTGQRTADGEVALQELLIQSPQARLQAHGRIVAGDAPLMERPLEMSFDLAAKDDTAVILSGMHLLRWKPDDTGYRPMKEPFIIGGKAGQPDTRPFYDLLAKAVVGSSGTWGILMRKVQDEVKKPKPPPPKKAAVPLP